MGCLHACLNPTVPLKAWEGWRRTEQRETVWKRFVFLKTPDFQENVCWTFETQKILLIFFGKNFKINIFRNIAVKKEFNIRAIFVSTLFSELTKASIYRKQPDSPTKPNFQWSRYMYNRNKQKILFSSQLRLQASQRRQHTSRTNQPKMLSNFCKAFKPIK